MFLYLVCIVIGLVLPPILRYVYSRFTSTASVELYDQADAVTLNLKSRSERTLWFNMGWWERNGEEEFPEAAALLCRKVALAARLTRGQDICEVGYGSGDSTLLLAREFSPTSYIGFTPLASQHTIASRRLEETKTVESNSNIALQQGDAATALKGLSNSSIDAVLAVDCAFHFKPRRAFFSTAATALRPDGTLALTDLLLPSSPLSFFDSLALRAICLLANLPFENLHTPSSYRQSLVESGFEGKTIEMEDISDRVWPGFLNFIERREREMGVALGSSWKGLRTYAKVVKWYSGVGGGRQRLRFYLISAKKRASEKKEEKIY